MPTETLLLELWAGQPRPDYSHEIVTRETVERLMDPILRWLRDGGWAGSEDEIKRELTRIIGGRGFLDGYALAKSLDSWNPDAELVEILDSASIVRSGVRTEIIRQWVKENDETISALLAKFPAGTRVSWVARQPDRSEVCAYGAVGSIWAKEAQAVIVPDIPSKDGCPVVDIENLSLA